MHCNPYWLSVCEFIHEKTKLSAFDFHTSIEKYTKITLDDIFDVLDRYPVLEYIPTSISICTSGPGPSTTPVTSPLTL